MANGVKADRYRRANHLIGDHRRAASETSAVSVIACLGAPLRSGD